MGGAGRAFAFQSYTRENIHIVRDVNIFHCLSVRLLSAQNQRVVYKLASQEYLGCARDQPMLGPFPAPPWKSPGDEVDKRSHGLAKLEKVTTDCNTSNPCCVIVPQYESNKITVLIISINKLFINY